MKSLFFFASLFLLPLVSFAQQGDSPMIIGSVESVDCLDYSDANYKCFAVTPISEDGPTLYFRTSDSNGHDKIRMRLEACAAENRLVKIVYAAPSSGWIIYSYVFVRAFDYTK